MGRVKNEILYYIEHPEELDDDYMLEYLEESVSRVEENPIKDNPPINDKGKDIDIDYDDLPF